MPTSTNHLRLFEQETNRPISLNRIGLLRNLGLLATMATSLAAQLAQVAANSKSTLNVKAQKAAHSKSLIWEPQVAAAQSYQSLYSICIIGFGELCQLDSRFARFQNTLFSEESQNQDRMQLTQDEVEQLDKQIDVFLRLVGSKLRLMPAVKSVEWLIRRFR